METEVSQGKEGEVDIHEHVVDIVVTQESTVETEAYIGKNDIQKFVDDTVVTQEPIVGMEVDQGHKENVTKSIDEVVVTQEPVAKVEHFHPREAVTPSIDSACGRTLSPDEGWCSENMLLLPELQQWK